MTIDVVFQAVDKVSKSIDGINGAINKISQSFDSFAGKMVGINQTIEAFDRMGQAVDEVTAPYREFEQSMAELSSITGITGDDLGRLGEVARKTGVDSGLGAKGASQAFALLASQIDVSKIGLEGLVGLQKETITLAQAGTMSMDESANAMAGTINQFGLQATEANRVINVLAAGSKYGAASIPDLSQSFKVVGAAANAAGLSIEDTAGVIEVLSKNNLKGAEAGTAMRNIMLKMQTTLGVDFTKTSFADALDALKPKMKDAAYMSKVFGMESMAAAQFLVANSDSVREMTDRVTGTNVATEQAAINTDTWNFSLDVQAARMNDILMSITENSKGIFTFLQTGSKYMRMITSFTPMFQAVKMGAMGLYGGVKWLTTGVESLGGKSRLTAAGIWVKNAAITAGQAIMSTYRLLTNALTWDIIRQGVANKVNATGVWIKNAAITAGQAIMSTYRLLTNALTWDIIRQGVANKVNAIWTAICSRAQMVASSISSMWAKRTAILTLAQGGLTAALNIAKIAMLTGVIPALSGVIASTWAWTVALLANPIVWIVAAVMALVGAIAYCWNNFEGFRAVIYTVWDAITGFGEAIWNFLVAPLEMALGLVKGVAGFMGTLFSGGDLSEAGAAFGKNMGDGIDKSTSRVKNGITGVQNTTSSIGDNYNAHLATETEKQRLKETNKANPKQPAIDAPGSATHVDVVNNREQPPLEIPIMQQPKEQSKVNESKNTSTPELPTINTPPANIPSVEQPATKQLTINTTEITSSVEQPAFNVAANAPEINVSQIETPRQKATERPAIELPSSMTNDSYPTMMTNQPLATDGQMPSPISTFASQTQTSPVFEQNGAQNSSQNSAKIDITYNPTINISGEMSQKSKDDFMTLLKNNASEMARIIKDELRKQERGSYGVPAIG